MAEQAAFDKYPFGRFFREALLALAKRQDWENFYAMEDERGIKVIQMVFESFHRGQDVTQCVNEIFLTYGKECIPFQLTILWDDKTYNQEVMNVPVSVCGKDSTFSMAAAQSYVEQQVGSVFRDGRRLKMVSVLLQIAAPTS